MNFKELVLEELINYDSITFVCKGKAWMDARTGRIMPSPSDDKSIEVYPFKDNKNGTWWLEKLPNWKRFNETPKEQIYRIIQEPSWYKREVGGYKRGVDRHTFRKKLELDIAPKLIDMYNLKQTLTPSTMKTFGDLIDEL